MIIVRRSKSLSKYAVLKLAEPFLSKGRSVTCDNFFTTLILAKAFKAKKTSILGTMNKIGRKVKAITKTSKQLEVDCVSRIRSVSKNQGYVSIECIKDTLGFLNRILYIRFN